jgi:acetyltransferase-like isoleucine patch superfamily enzyme
MSWLIMSLNSIRFNFCVTLRTCMYRIALGKIGHGTTIGCRFSHCEGKNIEIGNNVFIGHDVELQAKGKKIIIGDDCLIAQNVFMTTVKHGIEDNGVLIRSQADIQKEIVIENDVWIGAKSVILPGIHIGKGAVIGAGAVVTKNIPANVVAVGVPAQVIKFRKKCDLNRLILNNGGKLFN